MRLLEALSPSNIGKDIRLLLDVANPKKLLTRCLRYQLYVKHCYSERVLINEVMKEPDLVKHALGNRELVHMMLRELDLVKYTLGNPDFVRGVAYDSAFLKTAYESKHFIQGCLCYKAALEPFLRGRHSLEKMNVEEGSLYLGGERELVKEALLQANALQGPIIEVGTLFGYTTAWMAQWKKADKKIVTVDNYCWNPWNLSPASHKLFTHHFLEYLIHRGEVEMVDMDKNAFYESYRGPSPSLVFLDANHTYEETRKDIEWARRIGAKIIAGHDYCDVFGVVRAVDEAGGRCAGAATVWVLNGSAWQQGAEFPWRPAA